MVLGVGLVVVQELELELVVGGEDKGVARMLAWRRRWSMELGIGLERRVRLWDSGRGRERDLRFEVEAVGKNRYGILSMTIDGTYLT